ncbi:MAG: hypothetical protein FIA99_17630 [Ruminiclostridium sp.]|nr:hypothetical protein [Ruminiclostridium sp.]
MSKSLRVVFALITTAFILFSLIACGSGNTTESGKPTTTASGQTQQTSAAENELDKTLEIAWGGNGYGTYKIEEGGIIQKKLEEKFNVKLKPVKIDFSSEDKIKLLMLSGEGPDVGRLGYTSTFENYSNGYIGSIPIDLIKQYAPLHAAFLDSKVAGWKYRLEPGSKKNLIALAGADDTIMGTYIVPTYRLDWLEKSPVKPKGELVDIDGKGKVFYTTEAYTLDELEQVLNYFANGDPDGNGKKDTYGISPPAMDVNVPGLNQYAFDSIMGSYGLSNAANFNTNIDGKAVPTEINPALKDLLKRLNKWYKMGIIDKEFLTDSFMRMNEKLGNGITGYVNNQISYFNYEHPGLKTLFPANAIIANPNAKVLITPPEKGTIQAVSQTYPVNTLEGYDTIVGKDVSDEKLKRILMMYDYMNYTPEGFILTRFGVADDTFKWNGEPYKSGITVLKADAPNGYYFFNGGFYNQFYIDINYSEGQKKLVSYFQTGEGAKYASVKYYKYDFFNTTNKVEVDKQYGTALSTLYNEFITQAILGKIDVDAAWDGYVKKWMESGGDKAIAEIEKAPTLEELAAK